MCPSFHIQLFLFLIATEQYMERAIMPIITPNANSIKISIIILHLLQLSLSFLVGEKYYSSNIF